MRCSIEEGWGCTAGGAPLLAMCYTGIRLGGPSGGIFDEHAAGREDERDAGIQGKGGVEKQSRGRLRGGLGYLPTEHIR